MNRRCNEGVVASLMLAGIDVALALGVIVQQRGALRAALESRGIVEEWSAGFFIAALVVLAGAITKNYHARALGFVANAFLCFGTIVTMVFVKPKLLFLPFGIVMIVAGSAALALYWLQEREAHRGHQRGEDEGVRAI